MISYAQFSVALFRVLPTKLREEDKRKHFWICFALVPAIFCWTSLINAVLLTLLIGYIKELWDKCYGSGFCWYDMMANILGAGAGLTLVTSLYTAHMVGQAAW